jgi:multicomponent Na+:H+ antiporter subunit D
MVVLLVSSFLNAFYFLPIVYRAFFVEAPDQGKGQVAIEEAPFCCVVPLMITAIISVILFFYPTVIITLIKTGLGI